MAADYQFDLVVLSADNNIEHAIKGLLSRTESLHMCKITPQYKRHPDKDGGCRKKSTELLRLYHKIAHHALVIFDYEGCGDTTTTASDIEVLIEKTLAESGWGDRCGVVVMEPELERWVWTASERIPGILGHGCNYSELVQQLTEEGFIFDQVGKPTRPKEAVEMLLQKARKPRTSAIYREIAEKVSLQRCTDRSYLKLQRLLQQWFPAK